jgi:hypothetical protein
LVVLCLAFACGFAYAQQDAVGVGKERKIALVIGNAAYHTAALRNPTNDAKAMAAKLKRLGFSVTLLQNADNREMARAIGAFGVAITKGGVGLFYYAGHGMQLRGRNFLIPVDAQIDSEAMVFTEAIEADSILEQMAAAGNRLNIVILDACRNNPFERRFRGQSGGLAQTEAPTGSLIAYATAPGKVASDGDGANGLYTGELLQALDERGLKVEDVFKRVRARVAAATGNQQVPWEASSLTGDFVFNEAPIATSSAAADGVNAADLDFWDSIKNSKDPADYRAYLARSIHEVRVWVVKRGSFVRASVSNRGALSGARRWVLICGGWCCGRGFDGAHRPVVHGAAAKRPASRRQRALSGQTDGRRIRMRAAVSTMRAASLMSRARKVVNSAAAQAEVAGMAARSECMSQ